jgi:hypothetical protein
LPQSGIGCLLNEQFMIAYLQRRKSASLNSVDVNRDMTVA